MIEGVRAYLNDRWRELRPGSPPITGAIVAGVDKAMERRITYLFFDRSGKVVAVVKVARDSEGEPALENEHEALKRLWSLGVDSIRGLAPEPLLLERVGRRLLMVQSAVAGEPMTGRYYAPGHTSRRRWVALDFSMAAEWLDRFQRETRQPMTVLDDGFVRRWIQPVLERYQAEFPLRPAEAKLFDAVYDRAHDLFGTRLPMTGVHGDFWMGNLLTQAHQVSGVIDWEFASPTGLPFLDVYKFPTSYGFYLGRNQPTSTGRIRGHAERRDERWRRFGDSPNILGFGYSFFGDGWFPAQIRDFILTREAALSIPPEVNSVFFPLFLAEQALKPDLASFREGYRAVLTAFWEERRTTWLWSELTARSGPGADAVEADQAADPTAATDLLAARSSA